MTEIEDRIRALEKRMDTLETRNRARGESTARVVERPVPSIAGDGGPDQGGVKGWLGAVGISILGTLFVLSKVVQLFTALRIPFVIARGILRLRRRLQARNQIRRPEA